jgi:hypothetical protein
MIGRLNLVRFDQTPLINIKRTFSTSTHARALSDTARVHIQAGTGIGVRVNQFILNLVVFPTSLCIGSDHHWAMSNIHCKNCLSITRPSRESMVPRVRLTMLNSTDCRSTVQSSPRVRHSTATPIEDSVSVNLKIKLLGTMWKDPKSTRGVFPPSNPCQLLKRTGEQ